MNKTLRSIDLRTEQGQNVLYSKSESPLSALSLEILDNFWSKDVTLILSQGPLNLTPLISSIFAWYHGLDVLVGLPSKDFAKQYDSYTETFFELLYEQTSHFFFYKDVFWTKGELDKNTGDLCNLNIETYPKYGLTRFKKNYDSRIRAELKTTRDIQKPLIVFIPTQHIPAGLIGEKPVNYQNQPFCLKRFNPGLVILESVNEGRLDLESISALIKNIKKMGKKLVLHFSWPYLRRLDNFLSQDFIQNDPKVAVFHLGKRLCLELQDVIQKPAPYAIPISLEGGLWNSTYYPGKGTQLKFKVMLPLVSNLPCELNEEVITNYESTNDNWQRAIREHETLEKIDDPLAKGIVYFPPIIDSFLSPSETKIRSFRPEGGILHITLQDYVSEKLGRGSTISRLYGGLSHDLQHSRDLSYDIRGLSTYSAASKKTLLQTYILESLQTEIKAIFSQTNNNPVSRHTIDIVLLNLYPLLGSRGALLDSLEYLFDSISATITQMTVPSVLAEGSHFKLRIEPTESTRLQSPISVMEFNAQDFERTLTYDRKIPLSVDHLREYDESRIALSLNLNSSYLELDPSSNQGVKKRHLQPLSFYTALIKQDEYFKELALRRFQTKRFPHQNRLQMTADLVFRTSNAANEIVIDLNVSYLEPYQVKRLTREQITHSRLVIPGAIPFYTISDDALMICEHLDTLLLPFDQIVFLAYPGNNLKRLLKQIRSYNDIFSKEPTAASKIDLDFSLKYTTPLKRFGSFEVLDAPPRAQFEIEGDTAIDVAIRQDLMQTIASDDDERTEIITLKEIWDKIRRTNKVDDIWGYDGRRIFSKIYQKSQVSLSVEYVDGRTEDISFDSGTLLRKKIGTNFELSPVEALSAGDEILYIELAERESVDNYLLKDFMLQKEIQLEQILEPVTSLKIFYEALKSIGISKLNLPDLTSIYWLNDIEKDLLVRTVRFLMENKHDFNEELESNNDFYSLINDHFWNEFLSLEELISIFSTGSKEFTYSKLYEISKKAGMKLKKGSFEVRCSSAIHEYKSYFFRDEGNLLALAKMLGHRELISSFQEINELGKDIGTTLQIIGRCVARVSSGRSDPLNQMDVSIEDKLRKCRVLSISM